ncbi:Glycosyltransferase AglI [uncultured archaeon]|nr:Glycosyltransferase AglI [uncultured archaeon]
MTILLEKKTAAANAEAGQPAAPLSGGKEEFERSRLQLQEKHDLAIVGVVVIAVVALLMMTISYQIVFILYAVLSIFFFTSYLILWTDGAKDEPFVPEPKKYPHVTLIIPSYNSKKTIFECISACKAMQYSGKFDILVVDDGSTDGSREMLEQRKDITLLRNPRNLGKAAALNYGVSKAEGDIVCCIDSDTYPQPQTLQKAVKHFWEKPNTASVVVFVRTSEPTNLLQRIQEIEYWVSFGFFFKVISSINGIYVTPGPTALYDKSILQKLGGYDEKNLCEDLEIALRMQKAGYKICACHETYVRTDVPDNLRALYKQRVRWYRGGLMNMLRYVDLFFNPKYGELGLFVLPTMLGSGFVAALFMSWMLLSWSQSLINWAAPFAYSFSGGASSAALGFAVTGILVQSTWLLGLFSMAIWSYFVIKSFEMTNTEMELKHVLPLACLLWVYPIFIGIVYMVSYLSELFGTKYTW